MFKNVYEIGRCALSGCQHLFSTGQDVQNILKIVQGVLMWKILSVRTILKMHTHKNITHAMPY